MSQSTLYLIDGHAQFFRAYHAIRTRMTSPVTREPTNMTYGFMGMLIKLLRDHAPDYLAVVIDASGDRGTFRSQIYPEYKANREAPPEDFRPQVDRCLDLLGRMHIPVFAVEGVEADDVIATIARRIRQSDDDVLVRIVSRDKDLTQLSEPGEIELFDPYKDTVVTPADIFKYEGVESRHVVDILTLMGDTVDNVPGVAGIGPKTASKLVLEHGDVDTLYAALDTIKGKRRENLEAARDQIPLSRELVTLRDDLDVAFDLEAATFAPAQIPVDDVRSALRELNFRSHADAIAELAGATPKSEEAPAPAAPGDDPIEGGLFASVLPGDAPAAAPAAPIGDYELITTEEGLRSLAARMRESRRFAVDTETTDRVAMRASLCGVAVSFEAGSGVYVPVRSPEPEGHLAEKVVLDELGPILADQSITKVGHNLKYDVEVFARHGVMLAGPLFDTMIASYVIDATRSSHALGVLALSELGITMTPIDELIGKGRNQRTFAEVPLDAAGDYAAADADIALRLADRFAGELDADGLRSLFDDTEMPLLDVLAAMELRGICVDPDELERQRSVLNDRLATLRERIGAAAPHPFNPDSPKQLAAALFNAPEDDPSGLGLRVIKRGKTGPSTDQEVLEKLTDDATIDSPLPSLILEYRQLTKLVGTYLDALTAAIHPETGRIHASFNQTVAATGRLSSSDPNLQSIPVRTDVGRAVRRAFVAEPGALLVAADYSQVELRLLAHLAEDPALIDAFHQGLDIHRAVAAETFGVAPEDVTSEQRTTAKMINFGIVYGITAFGLARRLGGMSNSEAQAVIDDYRARYARIDAFLQDCVETARRQGWVETILGRRRRIPQVESNRAQDRAYGERMAINTVVQGSAADLIKVAMIDLHRVLADRFPVAAMVLQVHDELVFEVAADDAPALESFVRERMEKAMELRVPLDVDTAVGASWGDA